MRINLFIITLLLSSLLHSHWGMANSLEGMLKKARQGGTFKHPDKKELVRAEALFTIMLEGTSSPPLLTMDFKALKEAWGKLGYDLQKVIHKKNLFYALSEKEEIKTGRGFFLFPSKTESRIILEMPHSFKDLHTGEIGLKLFKEGNFAAAAWNTFPRYLKKEEKRIEADMSDLTETWFAAFTKAFGKKYPKGHVVQIHGFARSKRKSKSGATSHIIISAGNHTPPPWLWHMDTCLEKAFKTTVSRFPRETGELGATQTSIGKVLRSMGHFGFLHIELSKKMRKSLKKDKESRKKFLNCMEEVLNR